MTEAKKSQKTAVAVAPNAAKFNAQLPDMAVRQAMNRGNENVDSTAMTIARLRLLQEGSPEVKPNREEYIDGAQAGMWHNSVTNELYSHVYCVNLYFAREYVIFDNEKIGKDGFIGAFPTKEDAEAYLKSEDPDVKKRLKAADPEIRESHNHFLMILDENGDYAGLARVDCIKTRIRKSSLWNSQIMNACTQKDGSSTDRFAHVFELSSCVEKRGGYEYMNMVTEYLGSVDEELYKKALDIYTATVKYLNGGADEPIVKTEVVDE